MNEKKCISCGMPMRKSEDYFQGDESKKFCIHCTDKNGELKSFEQKVKEMTHFFVNTQGVDVKKAEIMAKGMLVKQPAWK